MFLKTLSPLSSLFIISIVLFSACNNDGGDPLTNNKGISIALSEKPKPILDCGEYGITMALSFNLSNTPDSIIFSNWVNDNEGDNLPPNMPKKDWQFKTGSSNVLTNSLDSPTDWTTQEDAYTVDVKIYHCNEISSEYNGINLAITTQSECD